MRFFLLWSFPRYSCSRVDYCLFKYFKNGLLLFLVQEYFSLLTLRYSYVSDVYIKRGLSDTAGTSAGQIRYYSKTDLTLNAYFKLVITKQEHSRYSIKARFP